MHDYSTSRWRSCKLLQGMMGDYKMLHVAIPVGRPCCLRVVWQASSLPAVPSTRTVEGCALPRHNDCARVTRGGILVPLTLTDAPLRLAPSLRL